MFVSPAQLVQTPAQLVQAVGQWHLHSQRVARRNALAAAAVLAERRRELEEVEHFLASLGQAAPAPAEAVRGVGPPRLDRGA
jgi:hypothetical protein